MNTDRLRAVLVAVRNDLNETELIQRLQELTDSLQSLGAEPGNAALQEKVSKSLGRVRSAFEASTLRALPPAWSQALEELGLNNALGSGLSDRIAQAVTANGMTPSTAAKTVKEFVNQAKSSIEDIHRIDDALSRLGVPEETLEPGEAEVSVLIPRHFVNNKLVPLGKEFTELDRVLEPFAELTTGTREGFQVRRIASSEFEVSLLLSPETAAAVAFAIERIVALYKSVLEIRKLRSDLAKQSVPEDAMKGILDHTDARVDTEIPKIANDVVAKFSVSADSGRNNELTTDIRISLRKIAQRVDRGFNFSVSAKLPAPLAEGEEESAEHKRARLAAESVNETAEGLKYIRLDGEPVLKLSAPEDANRDNTSAPGTAAGNH